MLWFMIKSFVLGKKCKNGLIWPFTVVWVLILWRRWRRTTLDCHFPLFECSSQRVGESICSRSIAAWTISNGSITNRTKFNATSNLWQQISAIISSAVCLSWNFHFLQLSSFSDAIHQSIAIVWNDWQFWSRRFFCWAFSIHHGRWWRLKKKGLDVKINSSFIKFW